MPSHEEQKERARQEAEHHAEHSNVVRSNADLSDQELELRSGGAEPHTSIIDQVTAGYALNDRRKTHEHDEGVKRANSIPERKRS